SPLQHNAQPPLQSHVEHARSAARLGGGGYGRDSHWPSAGARTGPRCVVERALPTRDAGQFDIDMLGDLAAEIDRLPANLNVAYGVTVCRRYLENGPNGRAGTAAHRRPELTRWRAVRRHPSDRFQ